MAEEFRVNIVGLSLNKVHHFDYQIGDAFFKRFGQDLISKGSFAANVAINKHETFLEVNFDISGTAELTCDRSLEKFDHPIKTKHLVVFKFGDENREITEEIIMIERDTVSLDLGQFIYEFISLNVPMKKLHPRFLGEDENDEDGKIVYSSSTEGPDNGKDDDEIDPRWEKLKKLK